MLGSPAPSLELPIVGGGRRSLADLRGRPVMISFLGPAHCNFCRSHIIRAIQHRDEFQQLGADVIFVAYSDPQELMAKMLSDLELPYTLLIDPARESYRRWGLGEAGLREWFSPGMYAAMVKAVLRRDRLFKMSRGPVQLGGDFVVDRRGNVSFVNRLKNFHDRASMPDLLAALAAA
ncbi:MAG TPA: redoxin domain-containing protein [Vicinamibacterales bacterium]|nr:redoxin domain-containing protein [Vicinamibacterales bacterium]